MALAVPRVDHFRLTMPGQPPSWNHMYRWTTKEVNGEKIRIQVLTEEANLYKSQFTQVARAAKPSGFTPAGQVYVTYDMLLGRDLDADNVMKAVNDALAVALGVNDKRFLPMTTSKITGVKDPRLVVHVFDADHWKLNIERT